jgi:hypothetical protein
VDIRSLGYQLLRGIVGYGALACITQRLGCAVPDTRTLDFASVVPDLDKFPDVGRGSLGREEKERFSSPGSIKLNHCGHISS